MDSKPPESPEETDEFLASVERQFAMAVDLFQDMTDRVKGGEMVAEAEAAKMGRRLFDAAQALIAQKNRTYDERKRQEGVANAYAIDLDAARDTVGRLLDRLRASGGSEPVSE